jgi:hypothetical protein
MWNVINFFTLGDMLCSTNTNPSLCRPLLELLQYVHADETSFTRLILEIISDLNDPAVDLMDTDTEMTDVDQEIKESESINDIQEQSKWMSCLEITRFLLENTTKVMST